MLAPDTARYLAARYPEHPSEHERLELASAIARMYANASGSPGRAIAKWIEHHLGDHDKVARARLRELTRELHAQGEGATDRSCDGRFLSVPVIALRLGLPVPTVRRMLRTKAGRRSLGWPVHLGRGVFRCPAVAADPTMRSQFLAGLSEHEPPHPEPLPEGYER
jgi:hypothetical protein